MNIQSIIIALYALIVLIGGIIGYISAHSLMSIIMAGLFAFFLFFTSYLMVKEIKLGHQGAFYLVLALVIFFTYRLAKTGAFMPAGLMAIISTAVLIYLIYSEKKNVLWPLE